MRESLANKKIRLAGDLRRLRPVTEEAHACALSRVPGATGLIHRVVCFNGAWTAEKDREERLVHVVFVEDGRCHVLDYGNSVEMVPHALNLAKEERRIARSRRIKAADRPKELDERLFIHFVDVVNPRLQRLDDAGGPFLGLSGNGLGIDGTETKWEPGVVAEFEALLGSAVSCDPGLQGVGVGSLQWDGLPPACRHEVDWFHGGENEQTLDEISCDRLRHASEDFANFRAAMFDQGKADGMSLDIGAPPTDRLVAALWCLRWQFGGRLFAGPGQEWEYNDGDGERGGGYNRVPDWTVGTFRIDPTRWKGQGDAAGKFVEWVARLRLIVAGWRRLSDRIVVFDGDDDLLTEEAAADQRQRFLAWGAEAEALSWNVDLYIPPALEDV